MSYQLGIDFGTTSVAAAVRRMDGPDVEVVPLGGSGGAVAAALHLARDGGVTVGEGALRLAGIDPGRVVRAIKRRIGDPAPIPVGRESWTAEELSARLLRWVVDRVAEREGGPAARVALAHPATWAQPTLERLADALDALDVSVTFVAEPQAVAVARVAARGESGGAVAVYDLGGGRFGAAVARRGDGTALSAFGLLGQPEGLADVGGLDFDDLVWQHVRTGLPEGVEADARMRRACLRAKEALSSKAETVVRVRRDDLRAEVRLDRATFEGLIAPHVARTVEALQRTLASAGLEHGQPAEVLLVGGSSRIPLVARAVAAGLGRPVTVVDDGDLVARGAALAVPGYVEVVDDDTHRVLLPTASPPADEAAPDVVAPDGAADPGVDAPTVALPVTMRDDTPTAPYGTPAVATAVRAAAVLDPDDHDRRGNRSRSLARLLVGAGAVVVAALVVVALFRADGPLDPPTDPVGDDDLRVTVAPALPLPTTVAPPPGVEGVRADGVPPAARTTAGPGRAPHAQPVDLPLGARSSDDASPEAGVVTTGPRPEAAGAVPRAEAPAGAEPRIPPTPAAPLV